MKVFTDDIVVLLNTLSCVRAKVKVLTSVGFTKLRFLWLILSSKILFLILIQRNNQLITRGF